MILLAIQVRMGSTRLPKKALADINGKSLLERMVERLKLVKNADYFAIVTAESIENNPIRKLASRLSIPCFSGREKDLLDRMVKAAEYFNVAAIARVTGDCPLIDPEIVDKVILLYKKNKADIATNSVPQTFPLGLNCDIISIKTLKKLQKEISDITQREWHVAYVLSNPNLFKIISVKNSKDLSSHRWTVDYAEDLEFVRKVFSELEEKKKIFLMKDVLNLLNEMPELMQINKIHNHSWIEPYKKELEKSLK